MSKLTEAEAMERLQALSVEIRAASADRFVVVQRGLGMFAVAVECPTRSVPPCPRGS